MFKGDRTTCLGVAWEIPSTVGNIIQTDSVSGDISFYVEQYRNNENFVCPTSLPGEIVQRPTVGALLSAYVAPTSCNITVTGGQSIQTVGIDAASSGQTVCVDNGSYTGPVNVNRDITLVSLNGPSVTTINGGIKITSSDATIKGFTINAGTVSGEPNPVGFYVAGGSNIMIDSNDIIGNSSNSSGVLFVTSASYSNVKVTNNKIHDNNAGIYTNPHTGDLAINNNDIYDNNAGIGGFTGATVQYNEFTNTTADGEAIGTDSSYDGFSIASFNNFLNGSKINDYGAAALVNAENNFFNLGGFNQTTSGQVDYNPEEGSAFPHN